MVLAPPGGRGWYDGRLSPTPRLWRAIVGGGRGAGLRPAAAGGAAGGRAEPGNAGGAGRPERAGDQRPRARRQPRAPAGHAGRAGQGTGAVPRGAGALARRLARRPRRPGGPGARRGVAPGAGAARALPAQPTSFLGRERELGAVGALLSAHRLVTLTGPGGVGKTRLALRAAEACGGGFPDGVVFVDLVPVDEAGLVAFALAGALGVREVAGEPPAATLAQALRGRAMLLVLDNFEHLLGAAPMVSGL